MTRRVWAYWGSQVRESAAAPARTLWSRCSNRGRSPRCWRPVFAHDTKQEVLGLNTLAPVLARLVASEEKGASGFLCISRKHIEGPFLDA